MKGIIFNLVEDVVTEQHGSDTWDDLLDAAELDGSYTSLGTYPDDDLHRLVRAGSDALGTTPPDLVRTLGRQSMAHLAVRFPHFFVHHTSTRSFLLTINDVIHAEVRKLVPGADVPTFALDSRDPDVLVIGYESDRRLCALAEGFVLGAADHYGELALIEQPSCQHHGDPACSLRCRFRTAG